MRLLLREDSEYYYSGERRSADYPVDDNAAAELVLVLFAFFFTFCHSAPPNFTVFILTSKVPVVKPGERDRKSTRLNSSHAR